MPAVAAPARPVALPGPADLEAARAVVTARLAPTPLVDSPLGGGCRLKLETFQPTGAFKVRGALAALARLPAGVPAVTASAGNHGLGVAWAARALGREATIVVPENASSAKVAALRALGADLRLAGTSYDEAERHALELAAEGAAFVSAYNDRDVIAGQATIGPELPGGPLCVVVPVGGGGLLAGVVAWAGRREDVRVVGVEAAASRAVSAAVAAGGIVEVEVGPTLADGLAGNLEPGSVTVEAAARAELVAVQEPELEAAMRALARAHGLLVEGAGAAGVAALEAGRCAARPGETVVALVTGRNIALDAAARILGVRTAA